MPRVIKVVVSGYLMAILTALAVPVVAAAADGTKQAAPAPIIDHGPGVYIETYDLSGASDYRTPAQQLVVDLVAAGEDDLAELVNVIITDNRETLDHIVVNLSEQLIYECNVSNEVLHATPISSGKKGYTTPTGEYEIVNRAAKAYSQKYEAWMLHWMGITRDGGYGLHGLEGSSYERLLGRVASHGCIRLSRTYAKELYSRIKIGLPVTIVDDPDLKLREFEPMSHQAAESMVLDVLSPADPWEVFY